MNKNKLRANDIIKDAFIECLNNCYTKSRQDSISSGTKITNPHYFEKSEFVSIDYIDQWGNIVYTEKQPGTKPSDLYHTIQVAVPYYDYKPFHNKWLRFINRDKNLNELLK